MGGGNSLQEPEKSLTGATQYRGQSKKAHKQRRSETENRSRPTNGRGAPNVAKKAKMSSALFVARVDRAGDKIEGPKGRFLEGEKFGKYPQ